MSKVERHFASGCQSKSVSDIEQEQSSNDERTEFFVGTGEGNENDVTMPWTMPILTSGTSVSYKLETGSQVNIIPQKIFHVLQKKPKIYTAKEKLKHTMGMKFLLLESVLST